MKVLKVRSKGQSAMGEAITLDDIAGPCDTEIIVRGASAKGPEPGAIVGHGRFALW